MRLVGRERSRRAPQGVTTRRTSSANLIHVHQTEGFAVKATGTRAAIDDAAAAAAAVHEEFQV